MSNAAVKKKARAYRQRLGYCIDCWEKPEPGKTRCLCHVEQAAAYTRRWRELKSSKRLATALVSKTSQENCE